MSNQDVYVYKTDVDSVAQHTQNAKFSLVYNKLNKHYLLTKNPNKAPLNNNTTYLDFHHLEFQILPWSQGIHSMKSYHHLSLFRLYPYPMPLARF